MRPTVGGFLQFYFICLPVMNPMRPVLQLWFYLSTIDPHEHRLVMTPHLISYTEALLTVAWFYNRQHGQYP